MLFNVEDDLQLEDQEIDIGHVVFLNELRIKCETCTSKNIYRVYGEHIVKNPNQLLYVQSRQQNCTSFFFFFLSFEVHFKIWQYFIWSKSREFFLCYHYGTFRKCLLGFREKKALLTDLKDKRKRFRILVIVKIILVDNAVGKNTEKDHGVKTT